MFDSVVLKNNGDSVWEKSDSITEDNVMFDVYTNSGDLSV